MKKISSNLWFLIMVVIFYLITLFFRTDLVITGLVNTYDILKNIILIIIGVFILIYLSHLYLKPKKVAKILDQSSGVKG